MWARDIDPGGENTVRLPVTIIRGFKRKGACLLGYNIIVVPRRHLKGLKRRSATLGSIPDLNFGEVH